MAYDCHASDISVKIYDTQKMHDSYTQICIYYLQESSSFGDPKCPIHSSIRLAQSGVSWSPSERWDCMSENLVTNLNMMVITIGF